MIYVVSTLFVFVVLPAASLILLRLELRADAERERRGIGEHGQP